jgi:hypothetical protein
VEKIEDEEGARGNETGNVVEGREKGSPCLPLHEFPPLASGWLYIQVATKTMLDPRTNVMVSGKLNNETEARQEIIMLKLVANPFKMLSAYLITSAVIKPPKTCIATVAHAQPPKLWKRSSGFPPRVESTTIGISAGTNENSDNCKFLTHRSDWEFLRTISK